MTPHQLEEEKKRIRTAFEAVLIETQSHDREFNDLWAKVQESIDQINSVDQIGQTLTLKDQAAKFDLELPDDPKYWITIQPFHESALTPTGRTATRKLIDDEKTRRFEVKVRWLKLLTPIIAALAGLFGAATGLVLALKK